MDLGLKGKNAIISGGSQGIGNAIAKGLAAEGCNIGIAARGEEKLNAAVKELEDMGVKAVGVQVDVSTSEGCKKFVEDAAKALGGIDILVNNVGGMIPGNPFNMDDEKWQQVINTNLMPYVWCTKFATDHLKKSSAPRILNVSGISGTQLLPGSYSTTLPNNAILGLTKLLANDLGPDGILVNSICPGLIMTDAWAGQRGDMIAKAKGVTKEELHKMFQSFTMLGRWGKPEEVGNAAAWLVSEKNSYQTGTTVEICGGWAKYIG